MDPSEQQLPGFSPHLQNQFLQASRTVQASQPRRERGGSAQGGGIIPNARGPGSYQHRGQTQYQSYGRGHHNGPQYPQPAQPWNQQPVSNPTDMNSFPPLGATRQQHPQSYQPRNQHIQPQQPIRSHQQSLQNSDPAQYTQNSNKEFHNRGRGRGGPSRGRGQLPFHQNQPYNQPRPQLNTPNADSFNRPPPAQRKLFTGGNYPHFSTMEEQRAFQRRIMDQSDFLNYLANQSLKNQLTTEEQQAKECFRKELETIVQKVVASATTDGIQINPEHVKLKLYGSLGSGFAVAGSDMDLILAFPQNESPLGNIEIETRRMLEKALLDAGIGARLLTNTRVPILRVCEKPSSELLQNLRDYRLKWEESLLDNEPPPVDEGWGPLPTLTASQFETAAKALTDLDHDANEIPIPTSPPSEQSKLEYTGDCGIQCDINFSNYVALHNTRLLKTYGSCDHRVRQVGVFVKNWAKARDINTPYRGTLSSYGYILMVLHYLMNVVNPPVIPNLQESAKQKDIWEGKNEPELFEGFDIRFVRDAEEIEAIMKDMPRNHESVGALLRGFFWYYADHRGYHWNLDVVSIRSRNGRMSKKTKGWTEAKRSGENQTVKLRYLLAIEDPFEVDHNIARTVGHSGIVAIREEFRRAWSIIEGIKFDEQARMWYWLADDGQTIPGQAMMAIAENRGDLHRKDQNFHRQKLRQMRLDVEAKEKSLQEAATEGVETVGEVGTNGTFVVKPEDFTQNSDSHTPPFKALINNGASQVTQRQRKQSRRTLVLDDDEREGEKTLEEQRAMTETIGWEEPKQTAQDVGWGAPSEPTKTFDWDSPFGEKELDIKPEWAEHHMEPTINEWNDVVETERMSNNAQVTVEGVVEENVPEVDEPKMVTKTFDWDAPFGAKELAIKPEWAEHHMDPVINQWDNAVESEQPSNDIQIAMSESVPEVDEHISEAEEPEAATKTFDWDAPSGEKGLAVNQEWAENHMDPMIDPRGIIVEPEKLPEKPPEQVSDDAQIVVSQSVPDDSESAPHIMSSTEMSEMRPEEPPKVVIPWSRHSGAGRWLLWRDSQIRAGTWTCPANQAYQELDEKFPYEPEMTVAQLAVKNKILDRQIWKNFNPRQAGKQEVHRSVDSSKIDASILSVTTASSVQSSEPITHENSNRCVTHSVKSNGRQSGKTTKHKTSSQKSLDTSITQHQDQATSQTNPTAFPSNPSSKSALSKPKRRNQNQKRNKRKELPTPDPQTTSNSTTTPPVPSHASLLLALLTPKASAPSVPPPLPIPPTHTNINTSSDPPTSSQPQP